MGFNINAMGMNTAAVYAMEDIIVSENGFTKMEDAAQYKGSDYRNAVRVERGISLERALEIAKSDPDVDYFVYVKGYMMVLEIPSDVPFDPESGSDPLELVSYRNFIFDSGEEGRGYVRIFNQGDVVFFKNDGKWLGTAPGLADVYEKNR